LLSASVDGESPVRHITSVTIFVAVRCVEETRQWEDNDAAQIGCDGWWIGCSQGGIPGGCSGCLAAPGGQTAKPGSRAMRQIRHSATIILQNFECRRLISAQRDTFLFGLGPISLSLDIAFHATKVSYLRAFQNLLLAKR
jgi:hypothetical protein